MDHVIRQYYTNKYCKYKNTESVKKIRNVSRGMRLAKISTLEKEGIIEKIPMGDASISL